MAGPCCGEAGHASYAEVENDQLDGPVGVDVALEEDARDGEGWGDVQVDLPVPQSHLAYQQRLAAAEFAAVDTAATAAVVVEPE